MGVISQIELQGVFTKKLIDVYKERISPSMFLKSFFPVVEASTLEISIEVQRGTEKIAVDVERGTQGNRNTFSRSTEKLIIPPYFKEFFEATDLDFYDRLFGDFGGEIDPMTMAEWINEVIDRIKMLQDKIDRAYELQCAEIFYTGVVTLKSGDNIDYKRKAGSLVDLGAAKYWDVLSTSDPYEDFQNAGLFIRKEGKTRSATLVAIMDSTSLNALFGNDKVKAEVDSRRIDRASISGPRREATMASFHGMISAGDFNVELWTYPEFYQDPDTQLLTPYVTPKQVVVLPENPRFKFSFAAVPVSFDTGNNTVKRAIKRQRGAYHVSDHVDDRGEKHEFAIRSAGVPVPVAIDQIYTMQVLA
jgi:hypothetical protein